MAYELKTKKNDADVLKFLQAVEPEQKRQDSFELLEIMQEVTGEEAAMWGGSIVGFGKYSYTYPSGHSGEMCRTGFSPRKRNLVVYNIAEFDRSDELMSRLGKHKTGKSCLYINRLSDVDVDVLRELIKGSLDVMQESFPS